MTTADDLVELALGLARAGANKDNAVAQILAASRNSRVAVVTAKRHLVDLSGTQEQNDLAADAVRLLDEVLESASFE